jgi:hypothetical protein
VLCFLVFLCIVDGQAPICAQALRQEWVNHKRISLFPQHLGGVEWRDVQCTPQNSLMYRVCIRYSTPSSISTERYWIPEPVRLVVAVNCGWSGLSKNKNRSSGSLGSLFSHEHSEKIEHLKHSLGVFVDFIRFALQGPHFAWLSVKLTPYSALFFPLLLFFY